MRATLRCWSCRAVAAELPMPLPRLAARSLHCPSCHAPQDLSRVQAQADAWNKLLRARLDLWDETTAPAPRAA